MVILSDKFILTEIGYHGKKEKFFLNNTGFYKDVVEIFVKGFPA